ncbi:MAG: Hpt domain-containing protein [Candidatus Marithrix sp.]|nr:Hpt domain-containing protein [Candidatus Marithrix sp.]
MQLITIPDQTSGSEIDEEIIEIFVEEVEEVLEEIVTSFKSWHDNPDDSEALATLRRNFHTLKGSGRMVGAGAIGELGWQFEDMFNQLISGTLVKNDNALMLVGKVEAILPSMVELFQKKQPVPYEMILLISQTKHFVETKGQSLGEFEETVSESNDVEEVIELKSEALELDNILDTDDLIDSSKFGDDSEQFELTDDLPSFDDDGELDIDLNLDNISDLELDNSDFSENEFDDINDELMDEELADDPYDDDEIDSRLLDIFKGEANEHIVELKNYINNFTEQDIMVQEVVRSFHTLNGSSRTVDLTAVSDIASPLENYAATLLEQKTELSLEIIAIFKEAVQLIDDLLNNDQPAETLQALLTKIEQNSVSLVEDSDSEQDDELPDTTDEFLEIFLDEAEEILENTQSLLERWTASPNNMKLMKELQRELHTLKGGARMVGIVQMGDLSHHLESVLTKIVEGTAQSSNKLQEIVQNSVDELAAMLEAIRSKVTLEMPSDLIKTIEAYINNEDDDDSEDEPTTTAQTTSGKKESEITQIDKQLNERENELVDNADDRIRVRATLIDKLTNLAGELSISRAHMEQQQGSIKNNLTEMEQTVIRLRDQLRRFEIETEAQIISHFGGTEENNLEFDPLELDQFSVMQQLSRSLMESISDLTNIEDSLKIITRQSDTLLIQQSRIGAELQENIMRTRMVPFSRVSPRLQRIARLTARELRKQADFVIEGENIEFERTVLNRVVAPLEHMLRNAIGHGVEDAQARKQAGKSTVAKITVSITKEGAELIIKLSDDGAGLNLAAIRQKAEERDLIQPDTVVSDYELMQFVLEPAFSTAKMVTQLSGRGVGMDVANSEIKQLGGNLRIFSKTGEGTTFEIRLPLSLTINQALLIHVGEETMAIPINHLDAVMRVPREQVIGDNDNKITHYEYMDKDYNIFHLGELLGFSKATSLDAPLIPLLLVRAADHRVALLVDGIEGSKEIVVKSIGPQIGAISWIAGASILGDGRVVIILDIPALTRIDINKFTIPQALEVEEEKVIANTIMVVDDSITVRKVTARLLKRQGMKVITAKDGIDAIAQLQENIPDLMLLDVEMPRMDGYELATQVRNNDDLKHIPIIMITSRTGAKHRDKAEKIGINRYLGKPFNETELLNNINDLLI